MSDHDTPEEIEARINQTQDDLRKDLEALEEKLSPENLKVEAWERFDEAKDLVEDKAVESTRRIGEAVRERIDDVARRFFDGDASRPSLPLLGLTVVIGVGLLLARDHRRVTRDEYGYDLPELPEHTPRRVPTPAATSRPYVR